MIPSPKEPLAFDPTTSILYIQIRNDEIAVEFTRDDKKNQANQRKHGISFETAILVFDDPLSVSVQDREVDGEARWQAIGMVNGVHICWSPTQ